MSFSGNLLAKSSYNPRFISLVPSKEQQSQISSEEDDTHRNQNRNQNHERTNTIRDRDHKLSNFQSKHHQPQRYCSNHYQTNNQKLPQQNKPNFNNLLQAPSHDYSQRSALLLERRIEEQIRRNHEKELYYGKRKNQIIEISDVSSEQEEEKQKNSKKRMMQEVDFQEDELLRKYGIQKEDLRNTKNQQTKKDIKSNTKVISIHSTSKGANQSVNSKSNSKQNKQNLQEENIFSHLNPDYEQEKPSHFDQEDSSEQMSEIDSDKSIIVIRRKMKHTHKRLRKMAHVTNKVKIQNKENSGQTHECPICLVDLNKKLQKKKGKLPCNHLFCLKCITESSKFSNRCPYCRASYNQILSNGKRIQVEDTHYNEQYEDPNDQPCYICGRNDDFEHLLECEFCEYAYCHTYCDPRLNNREQPPEEVWHCASCQELLRQRDENGEFGQEEQQIQESMQSNQ